MKKGFDDGGGGGARRRRRWRTAAQTGRQGERPPSIKYRRVVGQGLNLDTKNAPFNANTHTHTIPSSRTATQLRAAAADERRAPEARALAAALLAFSEQRTAFAELEGLKEVVALADAAVAAGTRRGSGGSGGNGSGSGGDDGGSSEGAAAAAAAATAAAAEEAARLLLPLLVQDGSRLLHRHLLGWAKRLPPAARDAAGRAVTDALLAATATRLRAAEAAAERLAASSSSSSSAAAAATPEAPAWVRPALSVAQAGTSLTLLPAGQAWLAPAAAPLLRLAARGVAALLRAGDAGAPLSPLAMDQLQEAITLVIHLLSCHGTTLVLANDGDGEAAVLKAADAMLLGLRSRALIREAVVSAAVAVWQAALLPEVPPAAAAYAFARGLSLGAGGSGGAALPPNAALEAAWLEGSVVERALAARAGAAAAAADRAAYGSVFAAELARCSPLGRLCALKGLVTALPVRSLCCDLSAVASAGGTDSGTDSSSGNAGTGWGLLIDGALPAALASIQGAPDAHFKYHAAAALLVALQRARAAWQQLAADAGAAAAEAAEAAKAANGAVNGGASSGADAKSAAAAAPIALPWLLPSARERVMRLVWALVDEPVAQTLRQVHDAFEALLDALSAQAACAARLGARPPPGCGAADARAFAEAAAAAVLRMPAGRKGRYPPLASLLPRVGAGWLLAREPRLVRQAFAAMGNDMAASAATAFFKALLAQLKLETATAAAAPAGGKADGKAAGKGPAAVPAWCAPWLPDVVGALGGPDERLRSYASQHGLPALLQAEPALLRPLLRALLLGGGGGGSDASAAGGISDEGRLAAAVAVLRAGRHLQLYGDLAELLDGLQDDGDGDDGQAPRQQLAKAGSSGSGGSAPASTARDLLLACAASGSEGLRIACLELACAHPRVSEPPGPLELDVARAWLRLCIRAPSSSGRSKALTLLAKLLARTRASAHALRVWLAVPRPGGAGGSFPTNARLRRGAARGPPLTAAAAAEAAAEEAARAAAGGALPPAQAAAYAALERTEAFLQWLSGALLAGLYPDAPSERKHFALELLALLLEAWGDAAWPGGRVAPAPPAPPAAVAAAGGAVAARWRLVHDFRPFDAALLSPAATAALVGGVVDGHDKLRAAAVRVLAYLPAPLPGLAAPAALLPLLAWARALLMSPRLRDADAGARIVKLVFDVYVLRLGWRVRLWPEPAAEAPPDGRANDGAGAASGGGDAPTPPANATGGAALLLTPPPPHGGGRNAAKAAAALSGRGLHPDAPAAAAVALRSLLLKAGQQADLASRDLAAAARHGIAHGPLLAARYAVESIPWATWWAAAGGGGSAAASANATAAAAAAAADPAMAALRAAVADHLQLLARAAAAAGPPLTRQDSNVAAADVDERRADGGDDQDGDENGNDSDGGSEYDSDDNDEEEDSADEEEGNARDQQQQQQQQQNDGAGAAAPLGPVPQVVGTACWTTLKEVAATAAALASAIPLPAADDDGDGDGGSGTAAAAGAPPPLLTAAQLEAAGAALLELLLVLKHNGAVDKVQSQFAVLCGRLLRAEAPGLRRLPAAWMRRALQHMARPGQGLDDIVRRSAGLPYALVALFLAEPPGVPRLLLPEGVARLLEMAADTSLEPWPRVRVLFSALFCCPLF